MNCQNSSHEFPRAAVAALLLIAAAMGGCVHRPYIQQGNYLETTDVDQVTSGMTRSQVRYLLGTPMISDPFTAQRWDYIYTLKRGRARKIDRAHGLARREARFTRGESRYRDRPARGREDRRGNGEADRARRRRRGRPAARARGSAARRGLARPAHA